MRKLIKIILLLFVATTVTNCSVSKNKIATVQTRQSEPIKIEIIGKGKPVFYLPGFTVPGSIWKETTNYYLFFLPMVLLSIKDTLLKQAPKNLKEGILEKIVLGNSKSFCIFKRN